MTDFSNQNKKMPATLDRAALKAQVDKLRRRPGWNPETLTKASPQEKMNELNQQLTNQEIYQDASACQACLDARQRTRDDTALCDTHMAEAMGF